MFFKPDFNLKSIYDIDLELLKCQGIKAFFFDLDSTLMVSKTAKYRDETLEWLKQVDEHFLIAIISNNNKCEYLEKVKTLSSFHVIGNAKKPSIKAMKRLLEKIGMSPKEVVVVGDRPLTDILAGKRLGAKTILVDSINAENEGPATRFVRWLERLFILI